MRNLVQTLRASATVLCLGVAAITTAVHAQDWPTKPIRLVVPAPPGAITDGVAVIHASGALVHRSRMDGASSYLLGYNELASQVEAAQANP